jgi:hypothetical protein
VIEMVIFSMFFASLVIGVRVTNALGPLPRGAARGRGSAAVCAFQAGALTSSGQRRQRHQHALLVRARMGWEMPWCARRTHRSLGERTLSLR